MTLAGVGTAGSTLRAYVDGRLASEGAVGEDGRWSVALDDVAAGLYTLRIDQIGPERAGGEPGRDARSSATIRMTAAAAAGRSCAHGVPPEGAITVQPGNNLWTLARMHYGSGMRYTQIFTANRALIRDPDLIYPGQIFATPAGDGTGLRALPTARRPEPSSDEPLDRAPRHLRRERLADDPPGDPFLWPPGEPEVRRAWSRDDGAPRRQARDGGDAVVLQGGRRRPCARGGRGAHSASWSRRGRWR